MWLLGFVSGLALGAVNPRLATAAHHTVALTAHRRRVRRQGSLTLCSRHCAARLDRRLAEEEGMGRIKEHDGAYDMQPNDAHLRAVS